jgi:FlaA1/EpsC-like NDP-sugar epimerase
VHITTDKAVDPVSVYGISKYLCERLVLEEAEKDDGAERKISFMAVRFGNVLGSRGSILPLFEKQIKKGGPVTVTHPDMKRWFMTIPEACSLVLKASGVGKNGDLYLLDMGEPVRIKDIAEQLIRFYGFEPGKDISIEYVGLRAGERLDEKLFSDNEEPRPTEFSRILKVGQKSPVNLRLQPLMERLAPICFFEPAHPEIYRNSDELRRILEEVTNDRCSKD